MRSRRLLKRFGSTPFSPPSGPPQRLFHEHPAKSKFLAAQCQQTAKRLYPSRRSKSGRAG